MNCYYQKRNLDQRINFFVKVIGSSLLFLGIIALTASIVKALLENTWNFSILASSILSLFLIILARRSTMIKVVNFAILNRQKTKVFIFFFPIILSLIVFLIKSMLEQNSWEKMNTEGGFIEYGTSVAFILASIFAIQLGKYLLSRKYKLFGLLYYLIGAVFIFVGLEEISWGQRLLGIESPDFFQSYNSQGEITIHNLVGIREYLDRGLMVVALILGISWLLGKISKNLANRYWFRYFVPSSFLSSFFLIVFIFFLIVEYISSWGVVIESFQEFIELLFSLGCLAFTITNFFKHSFD